LEHYALKEKNKTGVTNKKYLAITKVSARDITSANLNA